MLNVTFRATAVHYTDCCSVGSKFRKRYQIYVLRENLPLSCAGYEIRNLEKLLICTCYWPHKITRQISEHYDVPVEFHENRTVDEIHQKQTFVLLNNIVILPV
jgi:hypothetical protein